MEFLFLSIACSTALFILFKIFDRFQINTLQAIVVNYYTAFILGVLSYNGPVSLDSIPSTSWFIGAVVLSFLFISVFNLMAITSQRNGLSVASVAGKMSIIIPVISAIYLYNEQLSALKVVGIILALIAVYLTASKEKSAARNAGYLFPILLFFGSGIIDTTIKYIQETYVPISDLPIFSASIFLMAGILGVIVYLTKPTKVHYKNGIAGIVLGTINYYSIIYLLKALDHETMKVSIVFTINNMGIVMLTTLLGLFLFKERLILKNWIGIGIALISIFLIFA